MICELRATGETDRFGRAVFECAREGCPHRIAPTDPTKLPALTCRADRPPRHTAATWPCTHRRAATGAEVDCGCGERGAKLPVYGCELGRLCTIVSPGKIARIDGRKVAVCLSCPDRSIADVPPALSGSPDA